MTQTLSRPAQNAEQKKWLRLLAELATDVETWSIEGGWTAQRKSITLDNDGWGPYEAPAVYLRKGRRKLSVEPVARRIVGADGLVYIRGKLPFKKLLLARKRGAWKLFTDERIPWPEPWSESAFLKLAEALTAP